MVLASYDENPAEQAQTVQVNLVSATTEGKGGYYLDDGDVVHVKKRPKRAFRVMGLVNAPGEIELPPDKDVYLLDAPAGRRAEDAGGRQRAGDSPRRGQRIRSRSRDQRQRGPEQRRQQSPHPGGRRGGRQETPITMAFETLKTFFRFSVGSSLALF